MSQRDDRGRVNAIAATLAILTIAVVVVLVVPHRSAHHPTPRHRHVTLGPLPFSPTSVWNQTLAPNARLSPDSPTYVHDLVEQVAQAGSWINTTQYSVPVYDVSSAERRVPVTLDVSGTGSVRELADTFRAGVPIPAGATPAAGGDASMVIWQQSRDRLWELWEAKHGASGWTARWGGEMNDVSGNPGFFEHPSDWGASATSLALLGGLITPRDLRAGAIDHALAVAIPHAESQHFVYPAQRTDGNDPSRGQIPEGTRFRLPADLDVDALHLPAFSAMLVRAVQHYGMIVRDQSGTVSLFAQDPSSIGDDPWSGPHGAFGGLTPAVLLKRFPWADLQVVEPSVSRR